MGRLKDLISCRRTPIYKDSYKPYKGSLSSKYCYYFFNNDIEIAELSSTSDTFYGRVLVTDFNLFSSHNLFK